MEAIMSKRQKNKFCSLCFKDIEEGTKYNIFKHNTLFKDGPGFWIWSCQFPLLIHLLHLMAYDVDYPV